AYLYGILLRDPRSAARVLDSGGLHRDAAILYRDKVGDLGAAAACFERGACWDEAVGLYVRLEQYDKAGDVYRRVGDETSALEMFTRAADRLADQGRYRAAGDTMRDRAGLPDAAAGYYRQGWDARGSEAFGCGERLLGYEVGRAQWKEVLGLVDDAV